MLINIKGRNMEPTEALQEYATKKVHKLEKYFHEIKEAVVTMSVQRGMHIVEIQLEGDGVLLRGEERQGTDMYGSIDQVVEKLETRVKKFKHKKYAKSTEDGPKEKEGIKDQIMTDAYGPAQEPAAEEEAEPEEEVHPTIVRVKRFTMKPMAPEEAAQQMELLHHDFYLFTDSQTNNVCVVYKRDDGHYGLIEQA